MNTKYDDDIREVESRLVRERAALRSQAEDLGATARDAAVSPKGLLAALAIGFLIGELTPRKRRGEKSQAATTTAKVGIGGLIGSAIMSYARSQYGSPWALGRTAWNYAAAQRARRAAAAAAPPADASRAPSGRYTGEARTADPNQAAASSMQAVPPASYTKPLPTYPSHAAG